MINMALSGLQLPIEMKERDRMRKDPDLKIPQGLIEDIGASLHTAMPEANGSIDQFTAGLRGVPLRNAVSQVKNADYDPGVIQAVLESMWNYVSNLGVNPRRHGINPDSQPNPITYLPPMTEELSDSDEVYMAH
jgi:hypothetical protein